MKASRLSPRRFSKFHAGIVIVAFAIIGVVALTQSFAYRTVGAGFATINAYCDFSHRADDDPIVFPGRSGAAHSHDFFGAKTLDAFSTTQSIQQGDTSCDRPSAANKKADKSAYWVPTLYVNDQAVQPSRLTAQYRADYRILDKIQPFPEGLQVIAGTATGGPQEIVPGVPVWHYYCHGTGTVNAGNATTAPTCQEAAAQGQKGLGLVIRFPDCWDGVNLDSPNHKSHMAYSSQKTSQRPIRECPQTHPVQVPSLQFIITYITTGGSDQEYLLCHLH